jgi:L-asparagine permease
MPGSPWTSWAGLVALLVIVVLIGFDTMTSKSGEVFYLGLWTLATIPFFALLLWLGWQKVKQNEPKNALYS